MVRLEFALLHVKVAVLGRTRSKEEAVELNEIVASNDSRPLPFSSTVQPDDNGLENKRGRRLSPMIMVIVMLKGFTARSLCTFGNVAVALTGASC